MQYTTALQMNAYGHGRWVVVEKATERVVLTELDGREMTYEQAYAEASKKNTSRPKDYPRSYWKRPESNIHVVVGRGDVAARKRLKTRGYVKLRTDTMSHGYYWCLRSLEPGSYVITSTATGWDAQPVDADMTRSNPKSYRR